MRPIKLILSKYRHTRLYGSIGLSLAAHTLIFSSLGIALTLSHQQIVGKQTLTDIIAVLEIQDSPNKNSRSTANAGVISPAKSLDTTIAKSRPQKDDSSNQTKTAETTVKMSLPISVKPVKINPSASTITKNVPSVADTLTAKNPAAESKLDVSSDQERTSQKTADFIDASSQHQGTDITIRAPRFNAPGLTNPRPKYPRLARRKGYTGDVLLKVNVTKLGIVAAVSIAQSSGFSMLDQSALRTITNWRFLPAENGGDVVDAEILVPVSFRLVN